MRWSALAGALLVTGCYRDLVPLLCPTPDAPACADEETSTADASSTTGAAESETTGSSSSDATSAADTTATSDEPGTSSTSTGEGPVCGDGVVEGDEECDGAANCSDCLRDRLVFVTSADYVADFIGGLDGADALCRGLAVKNGLPNGPSFRAWLSSTTDDPASRFYRHPGRYVLVNGLVVADGWDELVSGALQNPIDATETGEVKQGGAWTGTLPDGTRRPGTQHCENWTSASAEADGYIGIPMFADANWTMAEPEYINPIPCFAMAALYCFEQE